MRLGFLDARHKELVLNRDLLLIIIMREEHHIQTDCFTGSAIHRDSSAYSLCKGRPALTLIAQFTALIIANLDGD